MAQLAIYIDDKTAREIKKISRRKGLSRSEWVSRLIKKEISGGLPEEFFQVLGSWEDDRKSEKIFKQIRKEIPQKERTPLR